MRLFPKASVINLNWFRIHPKSLLRRLKNVAINFYTVMAGRCVRRLQNKAINFNHEFMFYRNEAPHPIHFDILLTFCPYVCPLILPASVFDCLRVLDRRVYLCIYTYICVCPTFGIFRVGKLVAFAVFAFYTRPLTFELNVNESYSTIPSFRISTYKNPFWILSEHTGWYNYGYRFIIIVPKLNKRSSRIKNKKKMPSH